MWLAAGVSGVYVYVVLLNSVWDYFIALSSKVVSQ